MDLIWSQVCPRDPGFLQTWIPGTRPGTKSGFPSVNKRTSVKSQCRTVARNIVMRSTWLKNHTDAHTLEIHEKSLRNCKGCLPDHPKFTRTIVITTHNRHYCAKQSTFSYPTLEQKEDHTDTFIHMFSLFMVDPLSKGEHPR